MSTNAYPGAMSVLSSAFVKRKDYRDALKTVQLLRQYQDQAKPALSSCAGKALAVAYIDSTAGLLGALKNGSRSMRKKVSAELQTGLQDFGIAATGQGLGEVVQKLADQDLTAEVAQLLPVARATSRHETRRRRQGRRHRQGR